MAATSNTAATTTPIIVPVVRLLSPSEEVDPDVARSESIASNVGALVGTLKVGVVDGLTVGADEGLLLGDALVGETDGLADGFVVG